MTRNDKLPKPAITSALVINEVGQQIPMKLVGSFYTKNQMLEYRVRQPLTDEEIDAITRKTVGEAHSAYRSIARAVEAAHGIGGTP